jgi:hypothetical protein
MSDNDERSLDLAIEVLFAVFNRAWASMVGGLESPQDLVAKFNVPRDEVARPSLTRMSFFRFLRQRDSN